MSKTNARVEKYRRLYAGMRFERGGLFELIRDTYHPIEVLYPGCSIHLTPAFYFPHVCFVDCSEEAMDFFADRQALLDYVRRQRKYRRSPYIQFIPQDYTEPLDLQENQFDLLLSIFAGGVSQACKSYVKVGGFILTNNHHNDAVEAATDKELRLIASVRMRQGKYQLSAVGPGETISPTDQSHRYLRQASGGAEYIEQENYYIFQKGRSRHA